MIDLTGQSIGKYRILAPLDDDGRVARYRTTDPPTGQALVLALLPDEPNAPPHDLARLAALVGPHVVPILDWGTAAGWRYLALPELRGGDARRLLAVADGPQSRSSRAALALVQQAAEGVGHAHARGIVHGELRPERLLLDETGPERGAGGWVRLALFGLGVGEPVPEARPYAAPERLRGEAPTARGDVYALGAILGEALSGRSPGAGRDTDLSRNGGPGVTPPLDAILRRCLAADPAARYADANELAAALRAAEGTPRAAVAPDEAGITLALLPAALTLTPGEPTALRVAIGNGTGTPQQVALAFEGAPAGWLAAVPGEVRVAPGATEEVARTIIATRDAHEPAGEYPIIVRALPVAGATGEASVRTLWTLRPFAAATLTLAPADERGAQTIRLHNRGNAAQRYTLRVAAAAPLTATIAPATLDLDPDECATAIVHLAASRHAIGRAIGRAFTVEAHAAGAEPLRATGSFVQPARARALGADAGVARAGGARVRHRLHVLPTDPCGPRPPHRRPASDRRARPDPHRRTRRRRCRHDGRRSGRHTERVRYTAHRGAADPLGDPSRFRQRADRRERRADPPGEERQRASGALREDPDHRVRRQ